MFPFSTICPFTTNTNNAPNAPDPTLTRYMSAASVLLQLSQVLVGVGQALDVVVASVDLQKGRISLRLAQGRGRVAR